MNDPPALDAILPVEERQPAENRRRQVERLRRLTDLLRSVDGLEVLMLVAVSSPGEGPPAGSEARGTPAIVQHLALTTVVHGGRVPFDSVELAVGTTEEVLELAFMASASEALFDFATVGSRPDASISLLSRSGQREWHSSRIGLHALRSVAGRLGYVEHQRFPSPSPSVTAATAAVHSFAGQWPESERLLLSEVGFTALQGVCLADAIVRSNFAAYVKSAEAGLVQATRRNLYPARVASELRCADLVDAMPEELAVDEATVEAFVSAMTLTRETVLTAAGDSGAILDGRLIAPHGPNAMWRRPLVAGRAGVWHAPLPQLLHPALETIVAEQLGTDGSGPPSPVKLRFRDSRAKWMETEVAAVLARLVADQGPGVDIALNTEWTVGPAATAAGELDVIVSVDQLTILVECKSGIWSESQGQVGGNLRDLVAKPIKQLARFTQALDESGVEALTLTDSNRAAMREDDERRVRALLAKPVTLPVYVSLDDPGVFASDIARYRHAGLLSSDTRLPYVVSHQDLLLVDELLRGPAALAYLCQRARWNDEGSALFLDETEILTLFLDLALAEGEMEPRSRRALDWRAWAEGQRYRKVPGGLPELVVDRPDTSLHLSASTASLVAALDQQRPSGWSLACLALLSSGRRDEPRLARALTQVLGTGREHTDVYLRRSPGLFALVVGRGEGVLASLRADQRFLSRLKDIGRVPFVLSVQIHREGLVEVNWIGDPQAAFVSRRPLAFPHDPDGSHELTPEQAAASAAAQLTDAERAEMLALLNAVPGRNDPCPCLAGRKWKQCHG